MEFFKTTNFNYIKYHKIFFGLSGLLALISVGSFIVRGPNFSIYFTGGTLIQGHFQKQAVGLDHLRAALDAAQAALDQPASAVDRPALANRLDALASSVAGASERQTALSAMLAYYRAALRHPPDDLGWPKIETPSLLIWGEEDKALGKELTYGTERLVSDLTTRYIPRCSHWVQQEKPDEVNAILEQWLTAPR